MYLHFTRAGPIATNEGKTEKKQQKNYSHESRLPDFRKENKNRRVVGGEVRIREQELIVVQVVTKRD